MVYLLRPSARMALGRSSYARVMIKLRADVELKENIVVAMWYRISKKRTKIKSKRTKLSTKWKSVTSQSQPKSQPKSKSKSTPTKLKSKTESKLKKYLMGPPVPI
ncbi:hypothetical protein Tco_0027543 [Tanacetum coccineum]